LFTIKFKSSEGIIFHQGYNPLIVFNIFVELENKKYSLNIQKQLLNDNLFLTNDNNFHAFEAHLKNYVKLNKKLFDFCLNEIEKYSLFFIKNVILAKCDIFSKPIEIKIPSE
jgi:hypothetical protein